MKRLWPALLATGIIIACSNSENDHPVIAADKVTMLVSPTSDSCAEPYLFTDKNGNVYLSWIEKRGKESTLKFSTLSNDKWSDPITIASGKNWFVNWADYPVMATDGDNFLAHYLDKSDTAKFTYDVKLVSSTDSNRSWSNAKLLHDDGKKAEHGFVSIIPYNEQFFVCWLDGRKTVTEESHSNHNGHHGEMTLRAAFIDKNGNKINEWELDGKVCDCCQTSAAITSDGPVVVYRDRSDEEVRDMSIVRYVNGSWTLPKTIHTDDWHIKACPVNGPRVDAIKNSVAIVWFSMTGKKGEVKIIFSKDGGQTFDKPFRIDESRPIGRVDVLLLDSSTAMASWMEGASIKALKIYSNGKKEASITIASSSEARSSGFPQMTKAGNKVIFAWTDNKEKTIKVASISL